MIVRVVLTLLMLVWALGAPLSYGERTAAQEIVNVDYSNTYILRKLCGNRIRQQELVVIRVYRGFRARGYSPVEAYQATLLHYGKKLNQRVCYERY